MVGLGNGVDDKVGKGATLARAGEVADIVSDDVIPGRLHASITKTSVEETSNIFFIFPFYNY